MSGAQPLSWAHSLVGGDGFDPETKLWPVCPSPSTAPISLVLCHPQSSARHPALGLCENTCQEDEKALESVCTRRTRGQCDTETWQVTCSPYSKQTCVSEDRADVDAKNEYTAVMNTEDGDWGLQTHLTRGRRGLKVRNCWVKRTVIHASQLGRTDINY